MAASLSKTALDASITRTARRLTPFLMLMYVISFLDRVNIGFAKQALQSSVGISEHAYALAAGLFFVSYSLCGVPSNLILHKIGARYWLAFLMVAWGLVSMAMMFVNGGPALYVLRLLLGITEAGFFPGVILYLTYWFPGRVRGEILGLFYLGIPLAMILGGPLSGALLEMHPIAALMNWQWMFVVEGSLAVVVGLSAFFYLDNRPGDARWLPAQEKQGLIDTLAEEEQARRATGPSALLSALTNPRVMRFFFIYVLIQVSTYGAIFYLPSEISSLLHKPAGLTVGLVSAIPWLCTLAASYYLPRYADKSGCHRPLAAILLLVAGCAGLAFPTSGPLLGLVTLSIAVSGLIAVQPIFWTFPTGYLSDRAAAGGIALVGMGNIGGFIAPNLKVWADGFFGSPQAGLYLLAVLTLANAVLMATTSNRAASDWKSSL